MKRPFIEFDDGNFIHVRLIDQVRFDEDFAYVKLTTGETLTVRDPYAQHFWKCLSSRLFHCKREEALPN